MSYRAHTLIHAQESAAIEGALSLGRTHFGLTVGRRQYHSWAQANPTTITCLLDHHRHVVGYYDLLPLKVAIAAALIRGEMTEEEVWGRDLVAQDRIEECTDLYLAGFAVQSPHKHASKRNAALLLMDLTNQIRLRYMNGPTRTLWALAASSQGTTWLERFGFEPRVASQNRRDEMTLYSLPLLPSVFSHLVRRLPRL